MVRLSRAPAAHSITYSGGRDQEDHRFKARLKKPFTKIGLVEWLKVNALSSRGNWREEG
jgi:hypothetical protein